MPGLLGDFGKGLLGFVSDPQSWKDMGTNAVGLLGAPLPTKQEMMANALRMRMQGSVMRDYPGAETDLANSYKDKMVNAYMGLTPAGIVKPELARTLATKTGLPTAPEFAAAVQNTPGAAIQDGALSMRLMRSQKPEQALEPSVRGGVFYLPEGAAQGKHYSTGRNGYGGGEKITGETLISNPLFAKGGTGGKAPASAYDSLMGKGAYESMRTDALKSLGGWNASPSEKVAGVKSFLDKYAPELSDQAYYIVQSSRNGNQLPYALQEAAVGSAVRNAGHDAVLGYSKGKSGPFLSEVFDVRERSYPDKFGSPADVWEQYLK